MRKTYLLSTDHLEKALWFRDDEDFKVAMNYIAVQAAKHPEVVVLAFILMSNHCHFVLSGSRNDVVDFVTEFKRCYSIYYRRKYGAAEFLRRNWLDVREVENVREALEKAIAYVLDNPVSANICSHPSQYQWGSGKLYFGTRSGHFAMFGDYSARTRLKLFHTRAQDIPDNWIISESGYILPENYVDIQSVEAIFKTPKRMNFFLQNSSKAKKFYESPDKLPSFKDQSVFICIQDLCRSMFQKDSFNSLNANEQIELGKQIRYRFNSDANQIARVCGISYEEAAKLLLDYSG